MVRAYISVRATSRSGYIPPLEKGGRGRDRSPSLCKEGLGRDLNVAIARGKATNATIEKRCL